MNYFKRIAFAVAVLAVLVAVFCFPAQAAEADTVSIVWGKYTYTFDTTGCTTWEDLAETADAGFKGLFITSAGYAYYEYDFDNCFPIVDQDGTTVKGTDQITDETYTFGVISLSFSHEFEHFIKLGAAAAWYDLSTDGTTDENAVITETDGSMTYDVIGVGKFGIYNAAGQRVNENDAIDATHYSLKQLDYHFTIQEYKDGSPTGTVHTLTLYSPIDSWHLEDFMDKDTVFDCNTLENCHFAYHNEADGIVVLCVTPSGGSAVTRYCLLTVADLSTVAMGRSSLEPGAYYAVDPCSINYHSYSAYEQVKEATCTEQGYSVRTCKFCGDVEYKYTEVLKHKFNVVGTCKLCGYNGLVEGWNNLWGNGGDSSGNSSSGDKNIFEQAGDKLNELGNGISEWAEGVKNDTTSLFNTVLTVVAFVVLVALLPTLLPLFKMVLEGISFAFKSVGSLFRSAKRRRKRAYRR